MKQINRDRLEKYRDKLDLWINDRTCHLDIAAKQEILDVIREEFDPGYHVDMWCGACVVRMLEYAFARMAECKTETITVPLNPSISLVNTKKKK